MICLDKMFMRYFVLINCYDNIIECIGLFNFLYVCIKKIVIVFVGVVL